MEWFLVKAGRAPALGQDALVGSLEEAVGHLVPVELGRKIPVAANYIYISLHWAYSEVPHLSGSSPST